MIEREFIKEKVKYTKVKEYICQQIPKAAGIGSINIERTPLGEKIIVSAVKPGLIIGSGGRTIASLTTTLKTKFSMENPQIEVQEIETPNLSASVVANRIVADLERFGPARFKAIGHKALMDIMAAGALGTEIKVSGRGVPGARARSWRFSAGYMKKSGQMSLEQVDIAIAAANLRSGTVGVKVRLMPPTIRMVDRIKILEAGEIKPEVIVEKAETKSEAAAQKPKRARKKKQAESPAVTESQENKREKK